MTTLYAVRHAEYDNPENILPFRLEGFPLSESGKKQAQRLAAFFSGKDISAVYSNPQQRARQTAEIIAENCGIDVIVSSLIDETRSPLQGMLFSDYHGNPFKDPRHAKRSGETPEQIFERMNKFVREILQKHKGSIVFVSHGDPIEILKRGLSGKLEDFGILDEKRLVEKGNA
ncbi:MAG: histidine phosphatase family protein, partial [Candidatus Aenigmarchaeota archaeon]|nr:histidine phosphatase family protein [Candidatus Aenigmarchaeota archaeon]MDI6722711.1 histidine phosphatase family protein [Candidatus Aenigmarchaeota archaeon]